MSFDTIFHFGNVLGCCANILADLGNSIIEANAQIALAEAMDPMFGDAKTQTIAQYTTQRNQLQSRVGTLNSLHDQVQAVVDLPADSKEHFATLWTTLVQPNGLATRELYSARLIGSAPAAAAEIANCLPLLANLDSSIVARATQQVLDAQLPLNVAAWRNLRGKL